MKGIFFRRNRKQEFLKHPPKVGEIVYAIDTDEWGLGTNTGTKWRKHFLEKNMYFQDYGVPPKEKYPEGAYYFNLENGDVFQKINGEWKNITYPIPRSVIEERILRKNVISVLDLQDFSKILRTDGSVKLPDNYYPKNEKSVLSKNNVDEFFNFIKTDGSTISKESHPEIDEAPVFLGMETIVIIPNEDPGETGALWNDNGVVKVSNGSQ